MRVLEKNIITEEIDPAVLQISLQFEITCSFGNQIPRLYTGGGIAAAATTSATTTHKTK